ncbi:uncharacterized protein LOC124254686 [Haliotis rubra]|uniref:uncharacterized protein LOC124254686 n=1 Tax=Haliotis rubra TaxID=36100 RepID=UPI001EE51EA6|nr:uncharacterized protein LOC124254686 [Haliotis rubra]XP_046544489.1 uncharacterized protein LOC124254686 [Haliotis rubra]
MKLILVAALLVCLLAINSDKLHTRSSPFYWMFWRSTTLCIKSAAGHLSKCPGVQTNFQHNWDPLGKRAVEDKEGDDDQLENEDLVSARDVYEAVDAVDKADNSIHSIRQPTE